MNPDSASQELLWTQTQQHKNQYGTQTLHHKNWYGSQVQHHKNWCGTKTQHHKNSSGPRHSNTRIGIGPRHRVTKTGMGARKTIFSSSSLSSFFSFSFFLFHCLHVVLELVWTTRKPLHVIVTYIDLSTTYGTRLYRNSSLRSHSSPSPSSYLVITNVRHMLSSVKSPQSPSQRYSRGTQCPLLHAISWLPLHCPGGAAQHDVMMTLHNDAHVLTGPAWAKCGVCAWCHYAGIAQWLVRRTRDWNVAGSNPCWNGGRIFFSRVDFLCWLLFRYPFHPVLPQ